MVVELGDEEQKKIPRININQIWKWSSKVDKTANKTRKKLDTYARPIAAWESLLEFYSDKTTPCLGIEGDTS